MKTKTIKNFSAIAFIMLIGIGAATPAHANWYDGHHWHHGHIPAGWVYDPALRYYVYQPGVVVAPASPGVIVAQPGQQVIVQQPAAQPQAVIVQQPAPAVVVAQPQPVYVEPQPAVGLSVRVR